MRPWLFVPKMAILHVSIKQRFQEKDHVNDSHGQCPSCAKYLCGFAQQGLVLYPGEIV
jgi:hypothetical protein